MTLSGKGLKRAEKKKKYFSSQEFSLKCWVGITDFNPRIPSICSGEKLDSINK